MDVNMICLANLQQVCSRAHVLLVDLIRQICLNTIGVIDGVKLQQHLRIPNAQKIQKETNPVSEHIQRRFAVFLTLPKGIHIGAIKLFYTPSTQLIPQSYTRQVIARYCRPLLLSKLDSTSQKQDEPRSNWYL